MKFIANKKYVFYPDINGNLALPESERLSVEIIRPTAEERGEVAWYEGTPHGIGKETSVRVKFNTSRILRNNVGAIKNLIVEDKDAPDGGKAIASGPELAAASFVGMNALVDVICSEVCADIITDPQKKISGSPSASPGTDGTGGSSEANTQTKK
jgi:hypothetical protein